MYNFVMLYKSTLNAMQTNGCSDGDIKVLPDGLLILIFANEIECHSAIHNSATKMPHLVSWHGIREYTVCANADLL